MPGERNKAMAAPERIEWVPISLGWYPKSRRPVFGSTQVSRRSCRLSSARMNLGLGFGSLGAGGGNQQFTGVSGGASGQLK